MARAAAATAGGAARATACPQQRLQQRGTGRVAARQRHPLGQVTARAAPQIVQRQHAAGQVVRRHPQQRGGGAGLQRGGETVHRALQGHQRRGRPGADHFGMRPLAQVHGQPHRAVGQHALEQRLPRRERLAVEQQVRQRVAQRRRDGEAAHRVGRRVGLGPGQRVLRQAQVEPLHALIGALGGGENRRSHSASLTAPAP
nr:hypothetical protein [Piscinibacter sp.]